MKKIGVIGLGLIGGSIFRDLRSMGYDCIGISQSQKGLENVYSEYSYLSDCQIVFVCKEMSKTLNTLKEIEKYLTPETIVTDVCSLKEFLTHEEYKYNFVPSHPMAGTEFSGWDNSQEGLFNGAKWVITPLTKEYKAGELEKIIEKLGAEIVYTTPEEHDKAVAMISHAPMVMAQALFKMSQDNQLAQKLASSGFRDMTRLALSSIDMADDMVSMNSKNIQECILKFYATMGDLIGKDYKREITEIKSKRNLMYKDGKNVL